MHKLLSTTDIVESQRYLSDPLQSIRVFRITFYNLVAKRVNTIFIIDCLVSTVKESIRK